MGVGVGVGVGVTITTLISGSGNSSVTESPNEAMTPITRAMSHAMKYRIVTITAFWIVLQMFGVLHP